MWFGSSRISSVTSLTGILVSLAISSVRMLEWVGSRCWIKTKAMPVLPGKFRISSEKASMPPAEAPIAATRKSALDSAGPGPSGAVPRLLGISVVVFDFIDYPETLLFTCGDVLLPHRGYPLYRVDETTAAPALTNG